MPEQRVVKPFMVCAVVAAVFVCCWPVDPANREAASALDGLETQQLAD